MTIDFKPVSINNKDFFDKYYSVYPNISGYTSFVTLFCWRNAVNYGLAFEEGIPLIKFYSRHEKKERFFLPCTDEKDISKTVEIIIANSLPLSFQNITALQMDILEGLYPGKFSFSRNRDGDNYIYLAESLATLSGKKLHSKKNHLNKFRSTYSYEYIPVDETNIRECIAVSREWCERKCTEGSEGMHDSSACEEALNNFSTLGLRGGAITVNGKIIAFSLGEKVSEDTAIIHFEKADTSYHGAFNAINNEFILNAWKDVVYVNREEDMGIEGLRKAKLSYRPHSMLEVYNADPS